jgi:TolB-like protein
MNFFKDVVTSCLTIYALKHKQSGGNKTAKLMVGIFVAISGKNLVQMSNKDETEDIINALAYFYKISLFKRSYEKYTLQPKKSSQNG